MKPIKIRLVHYFFPKSDAITLWPFIFFRDSVWDDKCLHIHETYHWYQALHWGVVPWYLVYLALLPFYLSKPKEHPMEVVPYQLQALCYKDCVE